MKGIQTRREVKLSLLADNMATFAEEPVEIHKTFWT